MPASRGDHLSLRVDPAERRLIERAAHASRMSVSAFVLRAAVARAAEVLAERPLIELTPRSARAFDEALYAPATVNRRLAAALSRPHGFAWLDRTGEPKGASS